MKSLKSTIVWTAVIFVTLTFLTMKNEASSDGINIYGFPLTYYGHFEGKCDGCYSSFGLEPFPLLVDILFAATFGFFVTIFKNKLGRIKFHKTI